MRKRLCRSVAASPAFFFDLRIFQLPLRIRKSTICTPKITAAVDSEAAKVLMLWFELWNAAPVLGDALSVPVGCAELAVLDMLCAANTS